MTQAKRLAPMATPELLERLRRHYMPPQPMPGGVFVSEVGLNGHGPDASSGGKVRRCDALYAGFTSTSGRLLIGHELKVSRADWLHELASPGKADQWADQCHAWYVVAPSTDIVKPEELPHGWGLLTVGPSKTKMVRTVKAVEYPDRTPAWWAVRSLLARNDTLMEQTIDRRAENTVAVRLRERAAQEERIQGHQMKVVREIVQLVERDGRAAGLWGSAQAADIAAAVVGLEAVKQARLDMLYEIDALYDAAERLIRPIGENARALAFALHEIRKANPKGTPA